MDEEHEDNYILHGRRVSRATYYRWRAANRDDIPSDTSGSNHSSSPSNEPSPQSSPTSSSTPPVRRIEYSNSSSESREANSGNLSEPHSHDGVDVGIEQEVELGPGVEPDLNTWANIGFVDGRIPEPAPTRQDLAQSIENEVVGLQHDMDNVNVPITMQEKIFKVIFKKKHEDHHGQPQNYKGMGLGQLITSAGKNNIDSFFFYFLYSKK